MCQYSYSVRSERNGPDFRLHLIETDNTMTACQIVGMEYKFGNQIIATKNYRSVKGELVADAISINEQYSHLDIDQLFTEGETKP